MNRVEYMDLVHWSALDKVTLCGVAEALPKRGEPLTSARMRISRAAVNCKSCVLVVDAVLSYMRPEEGRGSHP